VSHIPEKGIGDGNSTVTGPLAVSLHRLEAAHSSAIHQDPLARRHAVLDRAFRDRTVCSDRLALGPRLHALAGRSAEQRHGNGAVCIQLPFGPLYLSLHYRNILPPRGEGGAKRRMGSSAALTPTPALRADPPRKGEGNRI